MTTWILLAHGSAAKIIEMAKGSKDFLVKEEFKHPQTAMKDLKIHSDRPGRTFARKTNLRHAIDLSENPKDHERHVFARELSKYLEDAMIQNSFQKIIIVASHDMLGELRQTLSPEVTKMVTHELSKDLLGPHLTDKEALDIVQKDLDLIHF